MHRRRAQARLPTFICGATQAAWKARPVSLNIPANTKPVRIVLEGTPLLKGMLVLTGCRWVAAGCVRLPCDACSSMRC